MKHRVTSPIVTALSIILIFSLAMGLVSCDTLWLVACDILGLVDHGAKYECPEWFTSEYCSENYIAMSENYVHTKAERKCVDKNDNVIHFNGDNDNLIVYTIRGEKIEDYALGLKKCSSASSITDDNMIVESIGKKVFCVDCGEENLKITVQEDISYAEFLIRRRMRNV